MGPAIRRPLFLATAISRIPGLHMTRTQSVTYRTRESRDEVIMSIQPVGHTRQLCKFENKKRPDERRHPA